MKIRKKTLKDLKYILNLVNSTIAMADDMLITEYESYILQNLTNAIDDLRLAKSKLDIDLDNIENQK